MLCLAAAAGAAAGWQAIAQRQRSQTRLGRIELLLDVDRHAEAGTLLAARLARNPHDNPAWMLEGRRRAVADDLAAAAAAFYAVENTSPFFAEAQFRCGQAAILRHDARVAEAAFRQVLKVSDRAAPMWRSAGKQLLTIWDNQGREQEAAALGEELVQQYQGVERATFRDELTVRDVSHISVEDRIAALRRYAAANPEDLETRGALAKTLCEDAKPEEAYELLAPEMARPGPKPYMAWLGWVTALYELQRFEELQTALTAAPEECRRESWYHLAMATTRQRANDLPAAFAAIQQAVALDERDIKLQRELATLARRMGRADLAVTAEKTAALWTARHDELRDAWKAWVDGNARRVPFADSARAATRLADACDVLKRPQAAEYYRDMARRFAAEALKAAAAPAAKK